MESPPARLENEFSIFERAGPAFGGHRHLNKTEADIC
jgi:hypothetical protein